ncbi:hypothetical protein Csa_005790, partial [Cucumis sativus]
MSQNPKHVSHGHYSRASLKCVTVRHLGEAVHVELFARSHLTVADPFESWVIIKHRSPLK